MNEPIRKRRGPLLWLAARTWRFRVAVALMPVLYVASFGPACWLHSHEWIRRDSMRLGYAPLIRAACHSPAPVSSILQSYAEWGARPPNLPEDVGVSFSLETLEGLK